MQPDSAVAALPVRRLGRGKRRQQILEAAKRTFGRTGFAHTSLDDVAQAADISKALIYRHFESKRDLYVASLEDFGAHLQDVMGPREGWTQAVVDDLVRIAGTDPDGFLLLFEHASREPEFEQLATELRERSVAIARQRMPEKLGSPTNVDWAARLVPSVLIQALVTWIQAGRPNPERAAGVVRALLLATTEALRVD